MVVYMNFFLLKFCFYVSTKLLELFPFIFPTPNGPSIAQNKVQRC